MITVLKSDLPQSVSGNLPAEPAVPPTPGMLRVPFNPNHVEEARRRCHGARQEARRGFPRLDPDPIPKGCSIISFRVKAFHTPEWCAGRVIRNGAGMATENRPVDFACVTRDGTRIAGHGNITVGSPSIIRRLEFIAALADLVGPIALAHEALDFASVRRSR